jgi:hypothetical protein
MTRLFAFFAATMISGVAVSTACTAQGSAPIDFRLDASRNAPMVHVRFDTRTGGKNNQWSTDFPVSTLAGLDLARLRGPSQPISFALVRESGRLDCAGQGGQSAASGTCRFAADPRFTNLLASRGIRRPTANHSFNLMALNVRRDLIDGLHSARYPAPTIDELMALAALGVDSRYIAGLAGAGYRPQRLDALVQFKAMGIGPDFIRSYVRHGYANLAPDEIVQLKALNVSGDYIASFRQAGYRNLTVGQLLQLKALGVTADYARAVRQASATPPSPERLVELKAIGFRPR